MRIYYLTTNIEVGQYPNLVLQDYTKLPNIITATYSMARRMRKPNPPSLDPGSNELYFVGSPNKYLIDPDLVINQDTRRVAAVDNVSKTGNDPDNNTLEFRTQEAAMQWQSNVRQFLPITLSSISKLFQALNFFQRSIEDLI